MRRYLIILAVLLVCCEKQQGEQSPVADGITPYYLLNEGDDALHQDTRSSVLAFVGGSYVRVGREGTEMDMPIYPRFIKTTDGRYLMFFHAGNTDSWAGTYCAYAESTDLLEWKYVKQVFPIQRNVQGHYDNVITRYYAGVHPVRLADGRIMAVASYRGSTDMRHRLLDNGLAIKFSSDEGCSWTQEIRINVGTNWEPRPLLLPSGRIVVYYTDSCPYIEGVWESAIISTGVSYIYSDDNGKTWKPDDPLNDHLHAFRQLRDSKNGQKVYTDQMPGVICLRGSGRLVGTGEANQAKCSATSTNYWVSLAYGEDDGSWGEPDADGVMPRERINSAYKGAAPTIEQFPSGEVVLTYNNNNIFYMRLGNPEAKNFSEQERFFGTDGIEGKGFWGSVLTDGHIMVAGVGGAGGQIGLGYTLQVGQYYLNHDISAAVHKVSVDGDNDEWPRSGQALFVGSRDNMHATIRCSVSDDKLYCLAEVENPSWKGDSKDGYITVYLASPESDAFSEGDMSFTLDFSGSVRTSVWKTGWYKRDLGVESKVVNGSGFALAEFSVPLSECPFQGGKAKINFGLGDGSSQQYVHSMSGQSTESWVEVTK